MIILAGFDPTLDILGSLAGHVYYFFDEVVPHLPETRGLKLLRAPRFFAHLISLIPFLNAPVNQNNMGGFGADDFGGWIDDDNDAALFDENELAQAQA